MLGNVFVCVLTRVCVNACVDVTLIHMHLYMYMYMYTYRGVRLKEFVCRNSYSFVCHFLNFSSLGLLLFKLRLVNGGGNVCANACVYLLLMDVRS